ncbi:uncharacterized protein LOC143148733 [Ptiloglossa arizonensis]|uniref:uncharacterized protein LOC143148733 n=1 Tax=Ptiloglossa arizonensis TaxID=3350558 RepID=UPI003F9F438C
MREWPNSYSFDYFRTTSPSVTNKMKLSQPSVEPGIRTTNSCRLCLRSEPCLTSIFSKGEASQRLRFRILDCCPVMLFEDNRLPQAICSECEAQVTVTYQFRERCRKSERWLRSLYGSSYSKLAPISNAPNWKVIQDCGVQTDEWLGVSYHSTSRGGQESGNNDRETSRGKTNAGHSSRVDRIEKKRKNEETPSVENPSLRRNVETNSESVEKGITGNKIGKPIESLRSETRTLNTAERRNENVERSETVEHTESQELEEDRHAARRKAGNTLRHDHDYANRSKPAEKEMGKPYLCDVCSKTFASKCGLRFHFKSHIGEKPHLCRYCGKGFAIPSYAKRHEKIHITEKRFICDFCSAAFASPNGLKYHMRVHTGEANHRCETCGKSFHRYKYLKEHIFTHTGEKPFVCKGCGSAYASSGSLFVHERKCKIRLIDTEEPESSVNASERGFDCGD